MMIEPQMVYRAGSKEMEKHAGRLLDVAPMLDFHIFTNSSHAAGMVANLKSTVLAMYGEVPSDISLATEDGASNNKKSAKLLGQPFKVCFPHDLQRAVLFSTGMTGKPCQNTQLRDAISAMSRMAAAPHRSVQVTSALNQSQMDAGAKKSRVLTTASMNATRWQGLYRMVNKNRRLQKHLSVALTGSDGGAAAMTEEPAELTTYNAAITAAAAAPADDDDDEDEDEVLQSDDDEQLQANVAANKSFPLAHRLLDDEGFKNNNLLESVLTHPNEVSVLVQKHEGMGLSLGFQMAGVLKEASKSQRIHIVSGTTKDGDWKEVHVSSLPTMFKEQRRIFAAEIEKRFKVDGTPDKHTLLALCMDPSVDTSDDQGIFATRHAAQELMMGEYRRRLLRRATLLRSAATAAAGSSTSPVLPAAMTPDPIVPAKRAAPPDTGSTTKKGPGSVLSLIGSSAMRGSKATVLTEPDASLLDVVKVEEAKFASICASVRSDPSAYMNQSLFDQASFWAQQKGVIPVHYALWLAEVGCVKLASANVESVFSGAGRISNKSKTLDPTILSNYAFNHYNYKYDWLRPTIEEIIQAYKKLYGTKARDSDAESDDDASGGEEERVEEEEEECDEQ